MRSWLGSHRWPAAALACLLAIVLAAVVTWWPESGQGDVETSGSTTTTRDRTTTTLSPTTSSTGSTTTLRSTTTTTLPPPPTTAPDPPPPAGTAVYRGDASQLRVALTFDAGSDAGSAAAILDILRAEGIEATFGITGVFAERYPAVVARIAADGHQLVNHTYDHPSFTGFSTGTPPLPGPERVEQLQRAEAAIAAAAGRGAAGWFRPPYGDLDDSVVRDAADAGWPMVLMWTVDSLGWKGISPDDVLTRCLERVEPGAIYLMHVGAASTDAAALPELIDALQALGYGFATARDIVG